MKLIRMDPPGTQCHYAAVADLIARMPARDFLEVGVGDGGLSKRLLARGLRGIGLDFSADAIALASRALSSEIDTGQYTLLQENVLEFRPPGDLMVDLGLSMMVMEHVADDLAFLRALVRHVRPGGHVIVSVPGRKDRWSIEDETVGHFRRYDRSDLRGLLATAGLEEIIVRSVSVPVANILHAASNYLIKRSGELTKAGLDPCIQTKSSGIREIPFKTVFPSWCRFILNPTTLAPLFAVQRLFYDSDFGLEIMAAARVPVSQNSRKQQKKYFV